jgi:hypothetical protein
MLLRRDGEHVLAIGQPAHAFISGQLARAWGNERFDPPVPREEVCLAACQHDVGMAAWDLEPELDREHGLPVDFLHMALETHLALWRAAPRRLLRQSRYAALLVSMHGMRLYLRRDLDELDARDAADVRCYIAEQEALQAQLIDSLRADPHAAAHAAEAIIKRNSNLIWTWDSLSLALCLGWALRALERVPESSGEQVDIALELRGADCALLDPWPFAGAALTVHCDAQRLRGPYASAEELAAALADAPWETLAIHLAPARSA